MPSDLADDDVVILAAVRTPIGRIRGALSQVRPDDLAAVTVGAAVAVGVVAGVVGRTCGQQAGGRHGGHADTGVAHEQATAHRLGCRHLEGVVSRGLCGHVFDSH